MTRVIAQGQRCRYRCKIWRMSRNSKAKTVIHNARETIAQSKRVQREVALLLSEVLPANALKKKEGATAEIIRSLADRCAPAKGWLYTYRIALGLTYAAAGSRLGVSASQVIKYEKGEVAGTITLNTLQKCSDALGFTLRTTIRPKSDRIAGRLQARAMKLQKLRRETTSIKEARASLIVKTVKLEKMTVHLDEREGSNLDRLLSELSARTASSGSSLAGHSLLPSRW